MARTAGKAVELPYQHAVDFTPTHGRHERVELRPAFLAARDSHVAVALHHLEAGMLGVGT